MNDLILAIIISASGYGAFLAIGIGCLIWYNIWNRKNMERNFETNEAFSARLEKPEVQLESGTTSWDGSSVHHSTLGSLGPHGSMGVFGRLFHARRQRHRASSLPSLSESAINDIFQGRRRSTQTTSTLVEDANRNDMRLAAGGQQLTRAPRRRSVDSRDSWEL